MRNRSIERVPSPHAVSVTRIHDSGVEISLRTALDAAFAYVPVRGRVSISDRDCPRRSVDPRLAHPSTAYSGITSYGLNRYDALRGTSLQSPVHEFDSHRRLSTSDVVSPRHGFLAGRVSATDWTGSGQRSAI